jgi:hypothetical protein
MMRSPGGATMKSIDAAILRCAGVVSWSGSAGTSSVSVAAIQSATRFATIRFALRTLNASGAASWSAVALVRLPRFDDAIPCCFAASFHVRTPLCRGRSRPTPRAFPYRQVC